MTFTKLPTWIRDGIEGARTCRNHLVKLRRCPWGNLFPGRTVEPLSWILRSPGLTAARPLPLPNAARANPAAVAQVTRDALGAGRARRERSSGGSYPSPVQTQEAECASCSLVSGSLAGKARFSWGSGLSQ